MHACGGGCVCVCVCVGVCVWGGACVGACVGGVHVRGEKDDVTDNFPFSIIRNKS